MTTDAAFLFVPAKLETQGNIGIEACSIAKLDNASEFADSRLFILRDNQVVSTIDLLRGIEQPQFNQVQSCRRRNCQQ